MFFSASAHTERSLLLAWCINRQEHAASAAAARGMSSQPAGVRTNPEPYTISPRGGGSRTAGASAAC